MTEIDRARPGARPGVSRRTLVVGAAWSVPVVVGLAAVPAVAASSTLTKPAVANVYPPGVGSYNPGEIQVNSVQVAYVNGPWTTAGIPYAEQPTTATFSWEVVILDSAGVLVKTLVEKQSVSLALDGNKQLSSGLSSGLPAGEYTVASRVSAVVYSPNPVNGVNFGTLDNSASTGVTVH